MVVSKPTLLQSIVYKQVFKLTCFEVLQNTVLGYKFYISEPVKNYLVIQFRARLAIFAPVPIIAPSNKDEHNI